MIYEYKCSMCQNEFEQEQKITDKSLKECPKCKKEGLQRLISKSTFILKGKNWEKKDGY